MVNSNHLGIDGKVLSLEKWIGSKTLSLDKRIDNKFLSLDKWIGGWSKLLPRKKVFIKVYASSRKERLIEIGLNPKEKAPR